MIIVYKSNTGYTEQYAKLLGKALEMPSYELSNVPECHKGAEVIYLGWLFVGTIVGYKKCARKYKVRCVAGVGMSPPTPELAEGLRATMKIPSAVPVFYLQGGFDITKLKGPMKLIMKVKCREIAGRLTAKPELNAAEQAETIRLLRMPVMTGMLASASTFWKLVMSDLPGSSEKPFWISKWVRVELITST